MAATKSYLSRQYLYLPLREVSVDLGTSEIHFVALMDSPDEQPEEEDWVEALVVTPGTHPGLYRTDIGPSLVVLVGPERPGEDIPGTVDLPPGMYLAWSDWTVPSSLERHVDWHGVVTILAAPGDFGSL